MTMLSLSRRLGITPRADHEYDPTAAGWLDSGRPEGATRGRANSLSSHSSGQAQARSGTASARITSADDHATGGPIATARGPHPLGCAEPRRRTAGAAGIRLRRRAGRDPADRAAGAARRAPDGAWPEICDQFGSHMLVLAEQLRASLNVLEDGRG